MKGIKPTVESFNDPLNTFTTNIIGSPDTDILNVIGDKISSYRSEIRELNMLPQQELLDLIALLIQSTSEQE